jgi:hypothetical protein
MVQREAYLTIVIYDRNTSIVQDTHLRSFIPKKTYPLVVKQPVWVEKRDFFGDGADDQFEDDDVELGQDVDVGDAAPLVQLVRQHGERQVDDSLREQVEWRGHQESL